MPFQSFITAFSPDRTITLQQSLCLREADIWNDPGSLQMNDHVPGDAR